MDKNLKASPTTKDVALLRQLQKDGQLKLRPEFQRESVWPQSAKSYLIDSVLNEKPIPLFFFQRGTSMQTGRPQYTVIDGQQRLRALFEFIDDGFKLSEVSDDSIAIQYRNSLYSELPANLQQRILNYDIVVQELSGYSEREIRDIFVRMNKYVVRLSKQELRNAKTKGKFHNFIKKLAKWKFWKTQKVFTKAHLKRMRSAEFAAELIVLLSEGPQDKKWAVDLYYGRYQSKFPGGNGLRLRLDTYLKWILETLPNFKDTRFRRSNELYSLIGALDAVSKSGLLLSRIDQAATRERLLSFERRTRKHNLSGDAARYVIAASKHADDFSPRIARIEILFSLFVKRNGAAPR
jgi:hypothetical protein